MLRGWHLGVAFVNASPVITNTVSKKHLSLSLFSEWITSVIMLHGSFRHRVTVISISAGTDELMDDATS